MNSNRFKKRRRELVDLFSDEQPVGPIQTPSDISLEEFDAIFESDNQIWKSFISQPSIVIGRKGAGKTAFLKGLTLQNSNEVVVFLKSNNVFRVSLELIQQFSWLRQLVFVEEIAEIWQRMFWILIGFEVLRHPHKNFSEFRGSLIRDYLEQFSIEPSDEYDEVFRKVLESVHSHLANRVRISAAFDGPASSIGFGGKPKVQFRPFREFLTSVFEKTSGRRALILIDNMEEIDFRIDNLPDAIASLLKAVSEFRKTKYNFGCTFCIPAEMFHKMLEISSNPSKDFERNILLQWRAGDLLKIATTRLAKYFYVHEVDFFMDQLDKLDLTSRSDVNKFWQLAFPENIINGLGFTEPVATYLLRHTQLLPRNILQILTEIFRLNRDSGAPRFEITDRAVIEGLRRAEVLLSQETFTGYRQIYPTLSDVCSRSLNRLPVVFKYGDLHHVFNSSGKASSGLDDFTEFRRMLLETGIIGKVIDRTAKYIIGLFEYTLPNRLNVTDRDELCVHPIFSGIYRAQRPDGMLPIYPYGSDPTDEEFRLSISV